MHLLQSKARLNGSSIAHLKGTRSRVTTSNPLRRIFGMPKLDVWSTRGRGGKYLIPAHFAWFRPSVAPGSISQIRIGGSSIQFLSSEKSFVLSLRVKHKPERHKSGHPKLECSTLETRNDRSFSTYQSR